MLASWLGELVSKLGRKKKKKKKKRIQLQRERGEETTKYVSKLRCSFQLVRKARFLFFLLFLFFPHFQKEREVEVVEIAAEASKGE